MSGAWGVVGGALCLMALDAAVKSQGERELTGAFKIADAVVRYIVDPTVPLIPDRRNKVPAVDNPVKEPKSSGGGLKGGTQPGKGDMAYFCQGPDGSLITSTEDGVCPAGWTKVSGSA